VTFRSIGYDSESSRRTTSEECCGVLTYPRRLDWLPRTNVPRLAAIRVDDHHRQGSGMRSAESNNECLSHCCNVILSFTIKTFDDPELKLC
jgi:hypothetical protein